VPSPAVNEATRREWRALGFFYDRDHGARAWTLRGSRDGLRRFAELLRAYANDPLHAGLWEHEHYGPFWYLEVMTATEPRIDGHAIEGRLEDLARLGEVVEAAVGRATPGERVEVGRAYAPASRWSLELVVEADNFDPASADDEGRDGEL